MGETMRETAPLCMSLLRVIEWKNGRRCYGWPNNQTDEQIMECLLALNLERQVRNG